MTNDLLSASDAGSPTILILLDISVAFLTVDHTLLLNHLETVFGIFGTVLNWFRSYLDGHRQFVVSGEYRSDIGSVSTGIPQGSILGPLLFSLYLYPLL